MRLEQVINAIKTVFDPEIPVNIWDLGLIYGLEIQTNKVNIIMTLTSPTCPMMEELIEQVKSAVLQLDKEFKVDVTVVWKPQWDLSKMSEKAKLELDLTEQGW